MWESERTVGWLECQRRIMRGRWGEDLRRGSCRFPVGPWNTWSNVAYVVVGWWVWWWWLPSAQSLVMALGMSVLGVGSFLYHGWKTVWANRLDHVGMYVVFVMLATAAVLRGHAWVHGAMVVHAVVAAPVLAYVLRGVRLDHVIAALLGLVLLVVLWFPVSRVWGILSVALFAVGKSAWIADRHGFLVPWGHALWHVYTAVAIGAMWVALIFVS